MSPDGTLSSDEERSLVALLSKLKPGFLPYPIFKELARIMVLPIIELVPLRTGTNGNVEVLLLPRKHDDEFWPDHVHTPGAVLLNTDIDGEVGSVLERIRMEELNGSQISAPEFVTWFLQKSRRGAEFAQVYFAEVVNSNTGAFYDVNKLPNNLIPSQHVFIQDAVAKFKKSSLGRAS